ncbi:MAG TPA: ATP-binding protein [Candidatus Polarisedimenticolia bacterium]|nr:ATP-binding protein [Candidatus Polarisedimenticolia bacterium]
MRELDRGVVLYIAATVLAAGLVLAGVLPGHPLVITTTTVALAVLGALVAPHAVHLGLRVEMSISHPFILATLILIGEPEAVVVSMICIGSLCLLRQPRMAWYRTLFNISSFVITTWLTGETYQAFGGRPGVIAAGDGIVALMLATLVFYLANTYSISGVVALANRLNLLKVWQDNFLWSAPSFLAGGSVALGMAYFLDRFGIGSFLLSLPFCVLIYYSYKLYLEKLEERRQHLKDIEQMNADLERKVRERTSELEVLNRKMQDSNQELARANSLKSEFLANMSHELRTPLNAIIGFSELLLDPGFGTLNDDQRGYTSDIHASGRHLLGLINDILDLSKIEAGKMRLAREVFEIGPVADEALALLKIEAARKGLALQAQVDHPDDRLDADRSKVKQILSNLLSNAVKFTPAAGRVTLTVRRAGEAALFVVEDTGIGIRPEDQERIFEAFTQVDGSLARQYQGTGLGLTLVRRFVELHGGTLRLESEPDRGSRFLVEIPGLLASEVEPTPGPEAAEGAADGEPRPAAGDLVLVIEDPPTSLKGLRAALHGRGHRVVACRSTAEALDALKFLRPRLILTDVRPPGADGLEAVRALCARPEIRGVPIVALASSAGPDERARAREAGCADVLNRPLEPEALLDLMARLVDPQAGPAERTA